MLPYNNQFKTYLVVVIPIYYNGQKIVALQAFSNETRIFHFQDYVPYQDETLDLSNKVFTSDKTLSEKEHGLMFLLSHGLTQEQCANVLGKPCVIITDMDAASYINKKISKK